MPVATAQLQRLKNPAQNTFLNTTQADTAALSPPKPRPIHETSHVRPALAVIKTRAVPSARLFKTPAKVARLKAAGPTTAVAACARVQTAALEPFVSLTDRARHHARHQALLVRFPAKALPVKAPHHQTSALVVVSTTSIFRSVSAACGPQPLDRLLVRRAQRIHRAERRPKTPKPSVCSRAWLSEPSTAKWSVSSLIPQARPAPTQKRQTRPNPMPEPARQRTRQRTRRARTDRA